MRRFAGIGFSTMLKPPTEIVAVRWRDESGDHAHGGGFAGAVRPEKPEHLASLDGERDAVDGQLWAESFFQILNFDHGQPLGPAHKIGAEKINKICVAQEKNALTVAGIGDPGWPL